MFYFSVRKHASDTIPTPGGVGLRDANPSLREESLFKIKKKSREPE